jgi:hypothetical protein
MLAMRRRWDGATDSSHLRISQPRKTGFSRPPTWVMVMEDAIDVGVAA